MASQTITAPANRESRTSVEPVMQAVDLQKTYGRKRVVDGVNLHVGPAEIVGLLGPNGAGKSTSFRMICGMVEPDHGKVFLDGRDVTSWPMFRRARDGHMGYLPQEPSVFQKIVDIFVERYREIGIDSVAGYVCSWV